MRIKKNLSFLAYAGFFLFFFRKKKLDFHLKRNWIETETATHNLHTFKHVHYWLWLLTERTDQKQLIKRLFIVYFSIAANFCCCLSSSLPLLLSLNFVGTFNHFKWSTKRCSRKENAEMNLLVFVNPLIFDFNLSNNFFLLLLLHFWLYWLCCLSS